MSTELPLLDKVEVLSSLEALQSRQMNCNDAAPIDAHLFDAVCQFVRSLPERGIPTPSVAATSRGTVVFNWEQGGNTLELEFHRKTSVCFRQRDANSGVANEHVESLRQPNLVAQLLTWFTAVRIQQETQLRGDALHHIDAPGTVIRLPHFTVGVRLDDGTELPCGAWKRFHHRTRIFCIGIPVGLRVLVRFSHVRKHRWPVLVKALGTPRNSV